MKKIYRTTNSTNSQKMNPFYMMGLLFVGLLFSSNLFGQCPTSITDINLIPDATGQTVECNGNDATFRVRAQVVDGSGNYDLVDVDNGNAVIASLTGQVSSFVTFNVTLPGPTTEAILNLDVLDTSDPADPACIGGTPLAVPIPACPECAITNVALAGEPFCALDDASFTVCADVIGGSGDYDLVNNGAIVASLTGQADGNICFDVLLPGPIVTTMMLDVRDTQEPTCMGGTPITLSFDCPADCSYDTALEAIEATLAFPTVDGKCTYLLVLQDAGGDGWDGASLDVSVNEGTPTNYKVTPTDGNCLTIPLYIDNGEHIDLTYWNGANESEHSYYLYDSEGNIAADINGNAMTMGPNIPANTQVRVKAQCAFSGCDNEQIGPLDFAIIGETCPNNPLFWEIRDSEGTIVYTVGPTIYTMEETDEDGNVIDPGLGLEDIYLDKCERYTIVLGSLGLELDSNGQDSLGWGTVRWELRGDNPRYGFQSPALYWVAAGDSPAPADFEGRMSMREITFPCIPDVPAAPVVISGGDPATCTYHGVDTDGDGTLESVINLPLMTPVACYPELDHIVCNDGVTVNVYLPQDVTNAFDDIDLGTYTYNYQNMYSDGSAPVVDTDGDGVVDAVQLDYSTAIIGPFTIGELAFPNDIEAGQYTICYEMVYNCQDYSTNVSVNDCIEIIVTTTSNPIMTCNDNVNVSLNYEPFGLPFFKLCQNEVSLDQVMEDFSGCDGDYVLSIEGPLDFFGAPVNQNTNIITAEMAGGTFPYVVTHVLSGNKCWGNITVEDKQAPLLSCTSYNTECNHPDALTLVSNREGYTTQDTFCIKDSQAIKLGTTTTGNRQQLTGGNQIDFPEVGCAPTGEVIKRVQLAITVEHTFASDVKIHILPPAGSGLGQVAVRATLVSGVESLLNVSSNALRNASYPALAGTWQLLLTDINSNSTDNCGNVTEDLNYGKLIEACLIVHHGFPRAYAVEDCNSQGSPQLLNEELIETDCNQGEWYGMTVSRIWQAVDAFGNSTTCEQVINLIAPTFDDINLPGDASFECGELTDEVAPAPEESGSPVFGCFDLTTEYHSACDVSYSYEDVTLPTCGSGKKIIRTWTIVSWCSGVTHTHEQIIKIEDTTGPEINTEMVVFSGTAAYDCTSDVDLGSAVTDACSGVINITATYVAGGGFYNPAGTLVIADVTNGELLTGLPFGETEVSITATDGCLNTTTQVVTIDVVDDTAPVAICDDNLHISLGADGTAVITAETFDEGSYDNCGDVTLLINNSDAFFFSDEYTVRCFNVGTVTLYLQVTDENGNKNTCWSDVTIEDALPPVITCAPDKTLDCDDDAIHDPFTEPEATDNCSATITDVVDGGELDQCKAGTLTRTWTASDGSDKSPDVQCTQRITVNHVSDFVIQFPADVTLTDCAIQPTGEPSVSDDDCELLAISSEDLVLDIVEDACYKIERTWTVINWCIYDQGNAASTDLGIPQPLPRTYQDDDGYFQYTQVIKVLDSDAPVIDCPGNQNFCDLTEGCEGQADLTITATDACSDDASLEYTYKIDAFNDGTFDIVANGNDASGVYPYGTHNIKWIVEDGCGNTSSCEYLFTVEDCKNPTPVCLNGLSIENMQTGCVDIWASDLLEYAFDNCTDATFVENSVRIRREGALTSPQSALTLCCEDVGIVMIEVWVEDEAGNADYCTTYIDVQDNLSNCDDNGDNNGDDSRNVAGIIRNEVGDNVEEVNVALSGSMSTDNMTGSTGEFVFTNLPMHNDYTLTPTKNMNPLNGVSTFDLVLISQHVLGMNPLDTPYKMIAADVNNDGNISTFDVVQLRQLILFIVSDFTDNSSWRFVDAGYMFPNAQNPWMETFPESVNLNNLSNHELANDFVAIKVGDVDGNAQANNIVGTEERNTKGTLKLSIEDAAMTAGQNYTVDFRASDFTAINGYQFTMNFDAAAMTFVNVEGAALNVTEGNFGFSFLNEGVITASWNTSDATTIANDEVLFTMTFAANAAANLSEVLTVNSRYTNAEAYAGNDLLDVALTFNTTEGTITTGGVFELYQNTPNPFNGETVIGFNLPTAATATLKIYDVSGRTLKVVEGDFARGYNQVSVNSDKLNATGVLYYQLDTPNDSATKKMIILE